MPKNILKIEIRNKDFGPVENNLFFQRQIQGVKGSGIGDGLFFAPPNLGCHSDQFGFEGMILPTVYIIFKDGSIQTFNVNPDKRYSNEIALALPGQSTELSIELNNDKSSYDIACLNLHFNVLGFGHSRGGGGGMSANSLNNEIGCASLSGTKIKSDMVIAAVSLSDRWDNTLSPEDYMSGENELININFLTRPKEINDMKWKEVSVAENWRATLAPYWSKTDKFLQEYNLHNNHYFIMPIKSFSDNPVPGWVIGINDSSDLAPTMKAHKAKFKEYRTKPEYIAERNRYESFFFNREEKAVVTTTINNDEQSTSSVLVTSNRLK